MSIEVEDKQNDLCSYVGRSAAVNMKMKRVTIVHLLLAVNIVEREKGERRTSREKSKRFIEHVFAVCSPTKLTERTWVSGISTR